MTDQPTMDTPADDNQGKTSVRYVAIVTRSADVVSGDYCDFSIQENLSADPDHPQPGPVVYGPEELTIKADDPARDDHLTNCAEITLSLRGWTVTSDWTQTDPAYYAEVTPSIV